jgi:hypothetical protein
MVVDRWSKAERRVGGWLKKVSVAGHFCGLTPNRVIANYFRKKLPKQKGFGWQYFFSLVWFALRS